MPSVPIPGDQLELSVDDPNITKVVVVPSGLLTVFVMLQLDVPPPGVLAPFGYAYP